MPATTVQRFPFGLALLFAVVLAIGALGALSGRAETLMVGWLFLGGLVSFALYAVRGDLLAAVLLWFVTVMCLHEEFWREPDAFAFALTTPRLYILVLLLLFAAMAALGRFRLSMGRPVGTAMLAFGAYLAASAATSGFETRSPVSVHYRLVGGYLFPFVVFWMLLHAFRRERDFRRLCAFFVAVGAYLTWIGWCEQFGLRFLLWPSFIGDPSVGIHWGRVRGPFVSSPSMGLALVLCFFSILVFARRTTPGRRWILLGLSGMMLPVLFWTRTRSVWLALAIGMIVWVAYSRRRMTRIVSLSLLSALLLAVSVLNIDNFLGTERSRGGLTDTGPILLRIGLAKITAEMVADRPLTGVGFGHFSDHALHYGRNPSSPFQVHAASAMEHNNLLSLAAETGLVGALLYVLLIVLILRCSVRVYRRLAVTPTGFVNRDLVVLFWILAAAFIVDGMFRETSASPFANSLFFGLSAMMVALDRLIREKRLPLPEAEDLARDSRFRRHRPPPHRPGT